MKNFRTDVVVFQSTERKNINFVMYKSSWAIDTNENVAKRLVFSLRQ